MKDVYFVVLPQLVLLDLAGPAEAFRVADKKAPGSYRLHFIAPIPSVQAAIGLQLSSLEPLPTKLSEDAIVVVTGVSGHTRRSWLRRAGLIWSGLPRGRDFDPLSSCGGCGRGGNLGRRVPSELLMNCGGRVARHL